MDKFVELIKERDFDAVCDFIDYRLTSKDITFLEEAIENVKFGGNINFLTSIYHKNILDNFVNEESKSWDELGYDVKFFENENILSLHLKDRTGFKDYYGYVEIDRNKQFAVDIAKALVMAKTSYNEENYKQILENSGLGFIFK